MELRHLKYFQVVSQLNSLTKAAEVLHLTQPSLTVAMQKLEEELKVPLFDRSQRSLSLTLEGNLFLQHVNDILRRVNDSVSEMQDYRTMQTGSIKVGIPPMIGVFLFPHIFSKFRSLYPNFELTIVEQGTLSILRLLEQGKLDIGFGVLFDNQLAAMETLPVVQRQIVVCLPHEHRLNALPQIPIAALQDEPFILLQEDTYNRQIIMEECKKHLFAPKVIFSTRQVQTIINLVEQGIGLSFLLDVVAQKQTNISSRPLEHPLNIQTGLVWRKDKYLSNALKAFIDFIKDSFPVEN
ncbi:MAG: cynR 5 [Anaerospora sp.]|jgi:DNA-binding transcriptional LysR family regulator|nr:cynR 5 [Anaerospora sp.]